MCVYIYWSLQAKFFFFSGLDFQVHLEMVLKNVPQKILVSGIIMIKPILVQMENLNLILFNFQIFWSNDALMGPISFKPSNCMFLNQSDTLKTNIKVSLQLNNFQDISMIFCNALFLNFCLNYVYQSACAFACSTYS